MLTEPATESMTSPRQTLSYLRTLFDERGIHPKSKLGQNFLIDLNLLELLLRSAELSPLDLVVEVGSGTGGMTVRLAEVAGAVLAVEVDPAFHELTQELVHGKANVTQLYADVLKRKNEINPAVFTAIADVRTRSGCTNLKLVANLPYSVAVPVVSNFLLSDTLFERMVVTVQWEIAERLLASPGCKDYGALAILVQSVADVTLVRQMPPSAFWPRPKVSSAIVQIVPNAAKRAHVGDVQKLRNFLRDLYVHRRKNLRGALAGSPRGNIEKTEVDRKLAELGVEGTVRAEDLDLEQHLRLCAAFG